MKQLQLVLGVTVLTLGILSVVQGIRATEPSKVDTNSNGVDGGRPEPIEKDRLREVTINRTEEMGQ